MTTRWRLKPFDADRVAALSREANVSPLIAQLLINAGGSTMPPGFPASSRPG